jgi:hypothetical protein
VAREIRIPRSWWRFMLFESAVFVAVGLLFIVRGLSVVPTETLFIADGAVLIGFTVTECSLIVAVQRHARRTSIALAILAVALLIAFVAVVAATLILRLRNIYV